MGAACVAHGWRMPRRASPQPRTCGFQSDCNSPAKPLLTPAGRRGGVVTQRIANPSTPVRFRSSPPELSGRFARRADFVRMVRSRAPPDPCGTIVWMHSMRFPCRAGRRQDGRSACQGPRVRDRAPPRCPGAAPLTPSSARPWIPRLARSLGKTDATGRRKFAYCKLSTSSVLAWTSFRTRRKTNANIPPAADRRQAADPRGDRICPARRVADRTRSARAGSSPGQRPPRPPPRARPSTSSQ